MDAASSNLTAEFKIFYVLLQIFLRNTSFFRHLCGRNKLDNVLKTVLSFFYYPMSIFNTSFIPDVLTHTIPHPICPRTGNITTIIQTERFQQLHMNFGNIMPNGPYQSHNNLKSKIRIYKPKMIRGYKFRSKFSYNSSYGFQRRYFSFLFQRKIKCDSLYWIDSHDFNTNILFYIEWFIRNFYFGYNHACYGD